MTGINVMVVRAKTNARYVCQECGSTELIQGHHQIPKDDNSIVVLCAICHSKKHPNVPLGLFFDRTKQPYWENKSMSSLAKEFQKHPRTIYRIVQRLNIAKGFLSDEDKGIIYNNLKCVHKKEKKIPFPLVTCQKCGHTWIPWSEKPERCAKCCSLQWDGSTIKQQRRGQYYTPENGCPECGDAYTVRCGFHVTKENRFQRRQCMKCGSTFYEKSEVNYEKEISD